MSDFLTRRLVKRGGSFSINLPPKWMEELGWDEKTELVIIKEKGELHICKVRSYKLEDGRVIEVNT